MPLLWALAAGLLFATTADTVRAAGDEDVKTIEEAVQVEEACEATELQLVLQPADWMDESDDFDGFRQLQHFEELRLAVSKSGQQQPGAEYTCPEGYLWASSAEVLPQMNGLRWPEVYYYRDLGGWEDLMWGGIERRHFTFSDSLKVGSTLDASEYEGLHSRGGNGKAFYTDQEAVQNLRDQLPNGGFAGIVCITVEGRQAFEAKRERAKSFPTWMETTDAFFGFRELRHFPFLGLAVAADNVYDADIDYQCPDGYKWAKTAHVEPALSGLRMPEVKYYSKQGGWAASIVKSAVLVTTQPYVHVHGHDNGNVGDMGTVWKGKQRFVFLFADSFETGNYLDAWDGEGQHLHPLPSRAPEEANFTEGELMKHRVTGIGNFAGIVCIDSVGLAEVERRAALADSFPDWMETTDGYTGFRELEHFPKIHLAVSHETKLNRERMFSCPIGHRWAKRQEVEKMFYDPRPTCFNVPGKGDAVVAEDDASCKPKSDQHNIGVAREPKVSNYAYTGGWSGGNWKGRARVVFLFKDTMNRGGYIMSGGYEGEVRNAWGTATLVDKLRRGSFAGIVCIEDENYLTFGEEPSTAWGRSASAEHSKKSTKTSSGIEL